MEKYIELPSEVEWYSTLEVSLKYTKWGANYFRWWHDTRWIYLHMKPCNVSKSSDWRVQTVWFTLIWWGWFRILLKELKRKSAKKMKDIEDIIESKYTVTDLKEMFYDKSRDKIFAMKDYIVINS